jgi:hypothetical protein
MTGVIAGAVAVGGLVVTVAAGFVAVAGEVSVAVEDAGVVAVGLRVSSPERAGVVVASASPLAGAGAFNTNVMTIRTTIVPVIAQIQT